MMRRSALLIGIALANAFQVRQDVGSRTSLTSPSSCSKLRLAISSQPPTQPLNPTTFAGMVEKQLIDRFGPEAQRVVDSWRLMEQGYEHKEFMGTAKEDPDKSNFHQYAHSFVSDLTAKTFWNVDDFEWCGKLAAKYKSIRREFDKVTKDMNTLQKEGNNIWAGALTDDATSYGTGWRTLVLMNRGTWDPINVNLFPQTAKAVRDAGIPALEVFFASMKPNTDIKLHSDFTNFVLTSHLALDIPESGNNKCRITVGDETRQWINGEVMLFDTSIMHDAVNEATKTRYILMFRVWHPDLTEVEKNALQFIYDCLEIPGLVSTDPEERFRAEMELEAVKGFPKITSGAGFGGGGGSKKAKRKKKR